MDCLKCLTQIEPNTSHYGLHNECFTTWFNAPVTAEFISLARKSGGTSDKTISQSPQNNSFFQGKFKKYSAELNGNSYILKMRQTTETPELPEVEYLCNQIGHSLGIPVAEFYFIDFNEDRVFVTKNFILPNAAPTDLQHIHYFRSDDQHSCEGLILAITEQTKRPYDVNIFIKTILFDALIGNHDRHGRNLAFIITAKNASLSPIYDNVSYLSLEKGAMLKADFNPTGKISTSETDAPSMRDYVKELKKLGYTDNLQEFYQSIKLPRIFQLIEESLCSNLMQAAIKTLITKRFSELENELSN